MQTNFIVKEVAAYWDTMKATTQAAFKDEEVVISGMFCIFMYSMSQKELYSGFEQYVHVPNV